VFGTFQCFVISIATWAGSKSSVRTDLRPSSFAGFVLALFPITQLARDGNTEPASSADGIRFTIAVIVDSAEEVDQLTDRMRQAGARVTKEPVDAEFFVGRSAYLCDPESNYFEIAWSESDNPIVAAARRAVGV
jgi:uncharacterized protein